jgi:uncharacterized membrane protein YgdD (TMEM256/DUF423 family)
MNGWAWFRLGAVLGFLGVTLGAFGAHGLEDRLERLGTAATYQTAVHYHMYHAFALLAVGLFAGPFRSSIALTTAGLSFLFGVIIFSGSLYVLALTGITKLGAITPIGGVLMLVGWAALATAASRAIATTPGGWSTDPAAAMPASNAVEFDVDTVGIETEPEGGHRA